MRCHEVRNLFGPYLDSELDAKTSFEIEQHLEGCADCARVFKAERELDARIFSALRRGEKTEAIWEKLEAQISSPTLWGRIKRMRTSTLAGLGVSLALGVALLVVLVGSNPWSLDLAVAVEKDHRAYLEGTMAPEFTGPLPEEIARTLSGRLDARAFSILPSTAGFRTEGARVCHLSGVPVAWTLGRCEDVPVSLMVFKKTELKHFAETQDRLKSGEPIVCIRTGRFQFAVRLAGDHVVCAIADTSKRMLEALVRSVH